MSETQPLVREQIIESLDLPPHRLSKITLFWYLKSLPDLTTKTIVTAIPALIGSVLTLILVVDWIIHRTFTRAQIEEALNYDLDTIDEARIQKWLDDPRLTEWVLSLSIWVFVFPAVMVLVIVIGWFVIRALQWRRIRFGCDDGVLWSSGGLFVSWNRQLPIVHVQSIEFRSTLLQRLLTLRGVSISSAAPEGRDATIDLLAIRRGVAAELAATVQTAFGATIATPEASGSASAPVASVSWKQLIVAAANSFEVRLSIISLYVFYRLMGQGPLKEWRDWAINSVTKYAEEHHDRASILLILIGALLFFWIFSIVIYIATFARFRLRRNGRLALIEHGLLTRRWRTVLLPRVQALSFVESPVQQLMNNGSLRITLPGTTRDRLERTMLLPSVERRVTIEVLERLFSETNPDAGESLRTLEHSLQRLPLSARRSYLLRWVWRLIPVCAVLAFVLWFGQISPVWGVLPLAIFGPIGAVLGLLRFRDAGWHLSERGNLIVRERALSRTTRITRKDRIIWTRVSRLRIFSGPNVTFNSSVAGAGARPGIVAKVFGRGLVARDDSRLRVRGLLDTDAFDLVDRLRRRSDSNPHSPEF